MIDRYSQELEDRIHGAKRPKRGPAKPEPQRPDARGASATAEKCGGFSGSDEKEGLAFALFARVTNALLGAVLVFTEQ